MTETEHYKLKQPEGGDYIGPEAFNENAEALDEALHGLEMRKEGLLKDVADKETPAEGDGLVLVDGGDGGTKKVLWSRVKAVLKGWMDTHTADTQAHKDLFAAAAKDAQDKADEAAKAAKAASRPSTWMPTAQEVGAIPTGAKGAAGGVAELDEAGKVLAGQLPSYVDDVLEYTNLSAFPTPGESGKIYVAQESNKTYRWSGSGYVEISQGITLGETSATAYRGDRGKVAYDHTMDQTRHVTAEERTAWNGKAVKMGPVVVTVAVEGWTGTGPWVQTVSVAGVTAADNHIGVYPVDVDDPDARKLYEKAYGCLAAEAETVAGGVKLTCRDACPETAFQVKVQGVK